MTSKELRATAEALDEIPDLAPDVRSIAHYILATVREDDDEPVTVEWIDAETPLENRSVSPYHRNYLLRGSIRLVAEACEGGFRPCVLWCGSGSEFSEIPNPTRGEIRAMIRGIRIK